jgi:hypothetical protein
LPRAYPRFIILGNECLTRHGKQQRIRHAVSERHGQIDRIASTPAVRVRRALGVSDRHLHPGAWSVNPQALAVLFDQNQGSILDMFNMFSGGALERASILALGIMPYISASIIMQLMSAP